jgi:type II secretory ATPase GspE/PulE/Tfp pilus assembly ATPase PilB-like protein
MSNAVLADGMPHGHSPIHSDPLEAMQSYAETVSASSGSYAMPFASSELSMGDNLRHFMSDNAVPGKIQAQLSKSLASLSAKPIAFGPIGSVEGDVLYVAINVERQTSGEFRPIGTSEQDDLLKVTTAFHDIPIDPERIGDPERVVFVLFNKEEYEKIPDNTNLQGLSAPILTLVQDVEPSKLFLRLVKDAVAHGASDVHIEPHEDAYRVRLRVDGALKVYPLAFNAKEASAFISHIKVRGDLKIEEKRLEQAGVIVFSERSKEPDEHPLKGISVRVSTLPTISLGSDGQAETCVLRIARRTSGEHFQLEKLGYSKSQLAMLRRNLDEPDGLILLTGPTGSGKTTTLYSCLMAISNDATKILTAEHPVEVVLPGIIQTPVDPAIGKTFEYLIRGFLRQDPDVIMIGEIRDRETADSAVSAVTTGHQVFSTMHVTRASEVVTRLSELGVAPSQMIGSLRLCIAQRLVRVFDPRLVDGLVEYDAASELNALAGRTILEGPFMAKQFQVRGRNSDDGLKGRTCVSEMWELGDASRSAILAGTTDALALQRIGIEHDGLEPMFVAGLRLVRQGRTSIAELRRTVLSGRDLREHADLIAKVAAE